MWTNRICTLIIIIVLMLTLSASAQQIQVVETVFPQLQDIEVTKTFTGNISPVKDVKLSAEISGIINSVNVEMGEQVKQGEVLLSFEKQQLQSQLKQAQAGLEQAKASFQKAENGARPEDIEAAEASVKQAEARLKSARANYQKLKKGPTKEEIARAEANYEQAVSSYEGAQSNLEIVKEIYNNRTSQKQQLTSARTQLDSAEKQIESARGRLEQSKATLEQAQNNLEQAKNEFDRISHLYKNDAVTEKQYEVAKNQYENAKASVKNSKSAVSNAEVALEQARINYEGAKENFKLAQQTYNNPTQIKQQLDSARNQVKVSRASMKIAKANLENIKSGTREEDLQAGLANLEQAEAALNQAKANYNKVKKGTRAEDITSARAAVKQAEASLEQARLRLEDASITTPISGTISQVNVDEGELVGSGTPVAGVVRIDRVYARTEVTADILSKIEVGDEVEVEVTSFTHKKLKGKITNISPVAGSKSRAYPVKILVNNPEQSLRPGMFVDVTFIQESAEESLTVPIAAVEKIDEDPYLFVAENGQALRREVELGIISDNRVEIVSGLDQNDSVIVKGQTNLASGDQVEVVAE